jgi:hypothetical protein
MSKKHADALMVVTREVPAFASKTFLTMAPKGTTLPYIVWHPANGVNQQDRVTGPRSTKNPTFTGHVVGSTAEQVLVLLDLLEARLAPGGRGIRIDVTGERGRPLNYSCPIPVQVQDDPQPTVVYGVVEVDWLSDPL